MTLAVLASARPPGVRASRVGTVLIWLPPSEGKSAPESGPRLDVEALSIPSLAAARRAVIEALEALGDGEEAARALGVGARAAAQLGANTRLWASPCAPASRVFTGVLYDAVAASGADPWERSEGVTVFSALFGALSPTDPIPDHRLAMGVSLPGLGPMARWWAPRLADALEPLAKGRIVLDCRSGPYRAACRAPWAHTWELRVERQSATGRQVVSHDAKRWRGAVAGSLMVAGALESEGEDECMAALTGAAMEIELTDARGGAHRVVGVECSEPRRTAAGGSRREVTLVVS